MLEYYSELCGAPHNSAYVELFIMLSDMPILAFYGHFPQIRST